MTYSPVPRDGPDEQRLTGPVPDNRPGPVSQKVRCRLAVGPGIHPRNGVSAPGPAALGDLDCPRRACLPLFVPAVAAGVRLGPSTDLPAVLWRRNCRDGGRLDIAVESPAA